MAWGGVGWRVAVPSPTRGWGNLGRQTSLGFSGDADYCKLLPMWTEICWFIITWRADALDCVRIGTRPRNSEKREDVLVFFNTFLLFSPDARGGDSALGPIRRHGSAIFGGGIRRRLRAFLRRRQPPVLALLRPAYI